MDSFAELTYLVLNPIFVHRRRFFLTEVMRHIGSSCLIIRMGPHQLAPDTVLPDFFQVAYLACPSANVQADDKKPL